MDKYLKETKFVGEHHFNICGSKSESNRLLILQALFPEIKISNLSNSDDTIVLQRALQNNTDVVDIHHAGTAMRFLTAYFAFYTTKPIVITGSERMQNRPIKILVDALLSLGAKIEYQDKIGYPPLKIRPSKINRNSVELKADVSSQYISALMLSGSKLPKGLAIKFTSKITSLPYIKMTAELMDKIGLNVIFNEKSIRVEAGQPTLKTTLEVESDWSSVSYFYSLVALSPKLKLIIGTYKELSIQGDSNLAKLYEPLGVKTTYLENKIELENTNQIISDEIYERNLNNTPDLAQTLAVTCYGLNLNCKLTGLHTLKIKETDRLEAMKTELEKFGAQVTIDKNSLELKPNENIKDHQKIDTYNDHRMAMAFAPLMSKTNLTINNANVVSKSYPQFWEDLAKLQN